MKKILKLILRLFFLTSIAVFGIMLYNALTADSKQIVAVPVEKTSIRDEVLDNLARAIQLPTVSAGAIDSIAFRNLDTLLQQAFPLIDSLLEREVVNNFSYIYKWPGRNPRLNPILMLAHTDIVPVEGSSEDKWSVPPFSGKIQDGYLWGRGTLDDKLEVLSMFEAVEILLGEGYDPERTIYFAFGQDEEIGGIKGAIPIAKIFAERNIEFEYILDEGSIILEKALDGLDKPLAMIGITEKGYTTLTITALLKEGGHSSMPPAETAVGVLSKAIVNLQEKPFPLKIDGATMDFFEYIGPESAFLQKMLFTNLWLTEGLITSQLGKDNTSAAILRTTTAPTMLRGGIKDNILPTRASAKVNFRIIPGETIGSVAARVRETINDNRVIVEVGENEMSSNPPPISPIESFGFQVIQKTVGEAFPEAVVAPSLVIAATDARHYTGLSKNIYRFSPIMLTRADLKRIHGIDERISTEGYKNMIRFYRLLFLNSCR
ncbi:MAG: carboxypeptidase PM20D1 [Saprospiraceae bacterium]|jgi:carboxypeptidase PM20D1